MSRLHFLKEFSEKTVKKKERSLKPQRTGREKVHAKTYCRKSLDSALTLRKNVWADWGVLLSEVWVLCAAQKEVLERFTKVHGDKYDYSLVEYLKAKNTVRINCSLHGLFEQ